MDDQIVTFVASPPPSRWTYLKTAVVVFVFAEVMNFFAQLKLVQELELMYSSIACGVVAFAIVSLLLQSPLTKRLSINYVQRHVTIDFVTLFRNQRTLTLPFDRLGIQTEYIPENSTSAKWKTWLLLDKEKTYLLLSSEAGFTLDQLKSFAVRVQEIVNQQLLK